MEKKINHSFLRKAAKGILDHLGEEEGEDPSLPDPDDDLNAAGQSDPASLKPLAGTSGHGNEGGGKRKKDAAMALLASNLASKFNK